MSLSTGQQALVRRIVTMTSPPNIALPNGPGVSLPRYVVQVSGGAQRTETITGTTNATPEIVVRVETDEDAYANQNDTLVAALVARFAPGDTFDGVKVIDAPLPRAPIDGAGCYSVPVIIRGRYAF